MPGPTALDELDDDTLVQRTLDGNRAAFAVLVERYQARVIAICAQITGDYDQAPDLAQEAFIRAYTHLARYQPGRSFFAWLYRIAVNGALNFRNRRDPAPVRGEPGACGAAGRARPGPVARSALEQAELAAQVQAAIAQLPPDYAAVLALRYGADLDYAAIAATLEIPLGTVKVRLFRAKALLRPLLKAFVRGTVMNRRPAEHPSDEQLVAWREAPADLLPAVRQGLADHLAACPQCPPGWRSWPLWKRACRRSRAARPLPPGGFAAQVLAALPLGLYPRLTWRAWARQQVAGLGCMLAGLVGAAAVGRHAGRRRRAGGRRPGSGWTTAGAGESDGLTTWLTNLPAGSQAVHLGLLPGALLLGVGALLLLVGNLRGPAAARRPRCARSCPLSGQE